MINFTCNCCIVGCVLFHCICFISEIIFICISLKHQAKVQKHGYNSYKKNNFRTANLRKNARCIVMVAQFCHYLSDYLVDLSKNIFVNLSDHYVKLTDPDVDLSEKYDNHQMADLDVKLIQCLFYIKSKYNFRLMTFKIRKVLCLIMSSYKCNPGINSSLYLFKAFKLS